MNSCIGGLLPYDQVADTASIREPLHRKAVFKFNTIKQWLRPAGVGLLRATGARGTWARFSLEGSGFVWGLIENQGTPCVRVLVLRVQLVGSIWGAASIFRSCRSLGASKGCCRRMQTLLFLRLPCRLTYLCSPRSSAPKARITAICAQEERPFLVRHLDAAPGSSRSCSSFSASRLPGTWEREYGSFEFDSLLYISVLPKP